MFKIKRSIPAELIIWENIGISRQEKCKKYILVVGCLIFLFFLLFVIVLFLESQGSFAEDDSSFAYCEGYNFKLNDFSDSNLMKNSTYVSCYCY